MSLKDWGVSRICRATRRFEELRISTERPDTVRYENVEMAMRGMRANRLQRPAHPSDRRSTGLPGGEGGIGVDAGRGGREGASHERDGSINGIRREGGVRCQEHHFTHAKYPVCAGNTPVTQVFVSRPTRYAVRRVGAMFGAGLGCTAGPCQHFELDKSPIKK